MSNPLEKQEGGQHYKDLKIQPIEYIHANNLGYIEGNIVKYVTRHSQKNGAEDIKKVIHYCELLLELEYGKVSKEEGLGKPISPEHRKGEDITKPNFFSPSYGGLYNYGIVKTDN
jgi:hypothetical protein